MSLGLPRSERAATFRALVQVLRNDPFVSRAVKTLIAWEGRPTDAVTLERGHAPALRLTPTGAGDDWMSPQSMVGPLLINCEVLTAGYNVDDPADLWRAVIAAIYAPTQTTFAAIQAQLRAAGAYPPSPMFTMPAFDPRPESETCFGVAQIRVMVQTQLGSRGAAS